MLVQLLPLSQYGYSFQQGSPGSKNHYTIIRDSSQCLIVGMWRDVLCVYHIISLVLMYFTLCHHKHSSSSWVVSHLCSPTLRSHNCLLLLLIIWLKFVSEVNHLEIRLRKKSWEFEHSLGDIVRSCFTKYKQKWNSSLSAINTIINKMSCLGPFIQLSNLLFSYC